MLLRTKLRTWALVAVTAAVLGLSEAPAHAYLVGPPVAAEELARKTDLVCKAKVVSDKPVTDAWFEAIPGFEPREAELRVISVIKGAATLKRVRFRHYAKKTGGAVAPYSPQSYDLAVGRSYIFYAASAGGDLYRQHDKRHTMKADQGVMRAGDDKPHRGKTVTDAFWGELRALLASPDADDVTYAITQLDELSGGRQLPLKDLDRTAALTAIRPLVLHKSEPVTRAAIGVFGADSPYYDEANAPYWLAGIGKGSIPGIGALTPKGPPTADVAVKELLDVAASGASPDLRALALRALGRSKVVPPDRLAALARDPDVVVRRAAVLVSAELADRKLIVAGAADKAGPVRQSAALAIGFTQDASLLPSLDKLVDDPDLAVRRAAAMSLLSFAPDKAKATLKAKLGSDFRPLFINALARNDAQPYLPLLGEVIEKQLQPKDWWGGMIPAGDSWGILFGYVKSRPAAELTQGKLDRSLDALEKMKWYSSSEPRDLYALYVLRGMSARAKTFRAATRKAVTYNIDTYFDEADKNPSTYVQ